MLSLSSASPISAQAAVGMSAAALAMVLTPGPNMMYLASRSIGQGRRAGLVSLAGTGVGFVVYMLMANLGLAIVFVAVPWLFVGLKAVGVAYLAWMTWQALRPGGAGMFEVRNLRRDGNWRLFRMGLLTNLLNPKVAIMYLTLIPQFIEPERGSRVVQGISLGLLQISVSLTVNLLVVKGAGSIANFFSRRPAWIAWQKRLTGSLLGVMTILLARDVPARAQI